MGEYEEYGNESIVLFLILILLVLGINGGY
ncbi:hypothetical protein C7959_11145 [Orenia marismortui]|uniref:Uncharacterized protein n=1 Tax=Orenia marismortui TaxID=46469 RepID=A0A4R8GYZ7_9FIRM|nr:hypothetical protein C7959_11145 [Orenia marismortui]